MSVSEILASAHYLVDKHGQQTAIVLDLDSWRVVQQYLEEVMEDQNLVQLMDAVAGDEKLDGEAALSAYQAYLMEVVA